MTPDPLSDVLADDRGAFFEDAPPSPDVALQRVAVRMLFDPRFVERVYDDPVVATAGLGISEGRLRQLVDNDRRLWNADPLRRNRALKSLMEEFKVTSTLTLARTGSLRSLDAFFGTAPFHDAVQRRGYMAMAFMAFLETSLAELGEHAIHARAVLLLEGAMARARRAAREIRRGRDPALRDRIDDGEERQVVAGGRRAARVPTGTVATIQHVERWLFEASLVPALALCDDAPRPEPLPTLGDDHECWLLEPGDAGNVEIVALEGEWFDVVAACARPRSDPELESALGPGALPRAAALRDAGVLRFVDMSG